MLIINVWLRICLVYSRACLIEKAITTAERSGIQKETTNTSKSKPSPKVHLKNRDTKRNNKYTQIKDFP
jgi:hypothetical protein